MGKTTCAVLWSGLPSAWLRLGTNINASKAKPLKVFFERNHSHSGYLTNKEADSRHIFVSVKPI